MSTDDVLVNVLTTYGVADSAQLPTDVQSAYRDAQVFLRRQAQNLMGGDNALTGAVGSIAANAAGALLAGDPAAAGMAVFQGAVSAMAMFGGPVGAAAALGIEIFLAAMKALPQAHGGGGYCAAACGDVPWQGAFILGQDSPPRSPSDPRWVHWDNASPRAFDRGKVVNGKPTITCSDDLPTIGGVQNCSTRNVTVTGNFTWLPHILATRKRDSFDYALAQQVVVLLEKYLNAQGPCPTTMWGVPGSVNLRDVAEGLIAGWNATHDVGGEPGAIPYDVDYRDHLEDVEGFHGSHYKAPTAKALMERSPDEWPGSLAGYFIANDPRDKSEIPQLHNGPPVKELRVLVTPKKDPRSGRLPVGLGSGGAPPPPPLIFGRPLAGASGDSGSRAPGNGGDAGAGAPKGNGATYGGGAQGAPRAPSPNAPQLPAELWPLLFFFL